MRRNLSNFLVGLASYSHRMARFAVNPAREARMAGLTIGEQRAVLSRDSRRLLKALKTSGFGFGEVSNDGPKPPKRRRPHRRRRPGKPARRRAPARKQPSRRKR